MAQVRRLGAKVSNQQPSGAVLHSSQRLSNYDSTINIVLVIIIIIIIIISPAEFSTDRKLRVTISD